MEIVWFLQKTLLIGILAPTPFYTVCNNLVQLVSLWYFYSCLFCYLENTKKTLHREMGVLRKETVVTATPQLC